VIYLIIFIFCLVFIDLKTLDMRVKTRHLNDAIPDFSNLIIFSKDQKSKKDMDWGPYKNYFELVLRYMPDDLVTRQLLGFVDYFSGNEPKAIDLFTNSSMMGQQPLFWSNYDLGMIYFKKSMWPQSAQYMLKAITSNPKLTVLLMGNSMVYRQILASPFFKDSISDGINDAQTKAYIILLSSLEHIGQYGKMTLIAKLAIADQDLTHKDAFYYYAGLSYFELGQMDNAFVLFQKSLSLEKNNPDVYYYIASIYQSAGKIEQARSFLQASYLLHQKNDRRFPYDAQTDLRFF
jgi:tetratricopeptide (TPR) repeat protein